MSTHESPERAQQSALAASRRRESDVTPSAPHRLHTLQRQVGNAAVSRMIERLEAPEEEEQPTPGAALQRLEAPEEEEQPVQASPEVGHQGGPLSDELAGRIEARRGGGAPLDGPLRAQMEGAFGTSFDDVRLHTDGEADTLNRRISARAFTTGSDIFFRRDTSPADQQLLAHELTHVVQQRGMARGGPMTVGPAGDAYEQQADAAAAAISAAPQAGLVSRSAEPGGPLVQRDGDEMLALLSPQLVGAEPPDMHPFNWDAASVEAEMPDEPRAIRLPFASHRPDVPAEWRRSRRPTRIDHCPPHHRSPSDDFARFERFELALIESRRETAWEAFTADVRQVVEAWNGAAVHVAAFNHAEQDPSLTAAEEFSMPAGEELNLHQAANQQRVGQRGTAVGDVFRGITVDGMRVSFGTEAEVSDAAVRRAGRDDQVHDARSRALQSDDALSAELAQYEAARHTVVARGEALQAAASQLELRRAGREADGAAQALAELQEARQRTISGVTTVLRVVELLAAGRAIGASAGGSTTTTGEVVGGLGSNAAHDLVGVLAEQIVNPFYSGRIEEAEAELRAARATVRRLEDQVDMHRYNEASADYLAALAQLRARQHAVNERLRARRLAYDQLARAARGAAGGGPSGERLQVAIAAIPIAETVVSRARAVLAQLNLPTYRQDSGVGYSMALYHGSDVPPRFLLYLSQLRGTRTTFEGHARHWEARLRSLRGVVDRMR